MRRQGVWHEKEVGKLTRFPPMPPLSHCRVRVCTGSTLRRRRTRFGCVVDSGGPFGPSDEGASTMLDTLEQSVQPRPECGAEIRADRRFVPWCAACDWNVDPGAPEEAAGGWSGCNADWPGSTGRNCWPR